MRTFAVVLVGGRSSRMGGPVPKPLLDLGGRTILARILGRISPQVDGIILSANDPALYQSFGLPIIADSAGDFAGPLAGLAAAATHLAASSAGDAQILSVAGDTPFLPTDLAPRLAAEAAAGVIPVAEQGGRCHPTIALWPSGSLTGLDLDPLAPNASRSLRAAMARHDVRPVSFGPCAEAPGGDPFFNVNDRDDLARARALVKNAG